MKLLVNAGADLNRQSEAGPTAVVLAAIIIRFEDSITCSRQEADYKLGSLPNCPVALTYYIVERPVKETSDQWAWREKAIDFLEAKGVDFEPAYRRVEKRDPVAAQLWRDNMARRAAKQAKRDANRNMRCHGYKPVAIDGC